jgi:hypothetical protein
MSEFLTENHPVIDGILNSNAVRNETKLLAVAELKRLESSDNVTWYDKSAEDVDHLFEWNDSELGFDFWSSLQDKVFSYSRSC